MDFIDRSQLRKSSAKALLTCSLCTQYFDDPRLLPCNHSFCRRCLQKYYDQKQAGLAVRVGRMTCPKCKTMIGIPLMGVDAFPADTKINRIKDLVINELAEDISKNIHSSQSQSDTHSSPRSDNADFSDFTDASEDAPPKRSEFSSSHPHSSYVRSEGMSDGSDKTGSSYHGNPLYPNMTKYAKYFVKEEDTSGSEGYTPRFKPAVRAERHRVGYSSSFQHRRRRIIVEPRRGLDDAADLVRQSRYGSAPHIDRENSSNAAFSSSDILRNMPQSSEELGGSSNLGSRMNTSYKPTQDYRHHHPESSARFTDEEFGTGTASMPSLSRIRREYAAGIDPGVAYTALRNTFSEPKFNSSTGTTGNTSAASSGSSMNGGKSQRSSQHEQDSDKADSRSVPLSNGAQGIPHASFKDKQSQYFSSTPEGLRTSLPTHRENIVTSADDREKAFPGINCLREENRSRLRATPRPHSDYFSDRSSSSFADAKPEATPKEMNTKTSTSTAWPSSASRSPFMGRARRNLQKTPSTENYSECKNDNFCQQIPFEGEDSTGRYNDFSQTKKQDEYLKRTKPDDMKMPTNFLKADIPKFHKSASFTSNIWQDKCNRSEDEFSNGHSSQKGRRGTLRRGPRSSSSTNLNQFDGCIKFELRNKRNLGKGGLRNQNGNRSFEDGNAEEESEMEQRNAFNERILNMRMKKEAYESIMADFKNGNLCSDKNLNESFSETVDNEDNAGKSTEFQVPSETVDTTLTEDSVERSDNNSVNMDSAEAKLANDNNLKLQTTVNGVADAPKSCEPVEEVGQNLKEMIDSMRSKYQATDVVDEGKEQEPVTLQPSWCESVCPKWNFQKTEFTIPTSIAITSKGCTVVADYGNSCLEFFDSDGNYEHKIEGIKPFSIVVNKLDQIIVGDRKGKAIRIFDEYGADVAQWDGGLFSWISGIALLANGNVVVYDRDRCKVGIYSSGGGKIKEFASYGVNDSQLCMADFLTADSKNRILVADSGNHCLKIFDTDGNFISKVASRGVEDGCLEWPKGICVDSMDNILVADSQNNRVSMFSPSGQFIQHVVTTTPSPYSVCYSSPTRLLGITHYALTGFSQYDVYQCLQ